MSIYKKPERFVSEENESFYPYYKCVIRRRMADVLASCYKYNRARITLEGLDDKDLSWVEFVLPDEHLLQYDRYRHFMEAVRCFCVPAPGLVGSLIIYCGQ
jgi:hypothetical protein